MDALYRRAIMQASRVRRRLGLSMFQSVNIFDACSSLGIDVRFVDVNMEGFYVLSQGLATILISNQRPLPRRTFTCGHELGHHIFGHGSQIDMLAEEDEVQTKHPDEILVDAFSAALLMPVGGIQAEFAKRSWNFEEASPIDYYTICSGFGVGYSTLVTHCNVNRLISNKQADVLRKVSPATIFRNHFGRDLAISYFKILDEFSESTSVDLEEENYLVVPNDFTVHGEGLLKVRQTDLGTLYAALKGGIFSAQCTTRNQNLFIRVQRKNYVGLANYRHFEI